MGIEKAGKESHLAEIAFASRDSVVTCKGNPSFSSCRVASVCWRSVVIDVWLRKAPPGKRTSRTFGKFQAGLYITYIRIPDMVCLEKERTKNLGKFQQLPSKILLVELRVMLSMRSQ